MISNVLQAELTPPLTYLKGEYALWKYKIPYFSTVLPMKFVADKFTLVDEIQGTETIEWSLDELFQRDVDWERIDDELMKYLRNENRPQFFNALTVALLPITGAGLATKYSDEKSYAKIDEAGLDDPIQIGGVQIQSYKNADGSAGKLRWDISKIVAVAVDGQHRLAAMKRLNGTVDAEKMANTSVPVIILLPDARIGYVEPQQPDADRSVISSLRRVFIDLNKNVRKVSRSRNILLDDLDIPSVCVRSLIGDKLTSQPQKNRLPLAVVDWVSDINKFETGPFVTTILTLDDLVKEILQSDGHFEPETEDDKDIKNWFVNIFSVSNNELEDLMDRVKRCYYQEIPLTFQPSEVKILRERFEEKWAPQIIKIFTTLSPYKQLVEYGVKNNLHKPEFVNLYIAEEIIGGNHGLTKAAKLKASMKIHDEQWLYEKNYLIHLNKINEAKANVWAFKVVFQKALFVSYSVLRHQLDEFVDDKTLSSAKLEQFTDRWIEAINALFATNLGVVHAMLSGHEEFWTGIGLSPDLNIEYTKISAQRISHWLNAWVAMYWMSEIPTLNQLEKTEGGIYDICWNSLIDKTVKNGMKKLVKAKDDTGLTGDNFDAEVWRQIELRYMKFRKELSK